MNSLEQNTKQVGFNINNWCKSVGISRSLFYTLPNESKPNLIKIGDRTIIIENPELWLQRVAKLGGVEIVGRSTK